MDAIFLIQSLSPLSGSVLLTHKYHDLCVQSVAYDRSSAPKDFQIRGWYQGTHDDSDKDSNVMATLGEFSYSLDGSNAQTFQLERTANPQAVNMVRFDFSSNHGNLELTCIYRFRVHGTEPGSLSNLAWCPHLWAAHQSLKDYWIPFANQSTSSALRVLSQTVLGQVQEWMPEQKLKGLSSLQVTAPTFILLRLISVVCTLFTNSSWRFVPS